MSQRSEILSRLVTGASITQMEALNLYGCFRLASRIEELRANHEIRTDMIGTGGKKYASYVLVN